MLNGSLNIEHRLIVFFQQHPYLKFLLLQISHIPKIVELITKRTIFFQGNSLDKWQLLGEIDNGVWLFFYFYTRTSLILGWPSWKYMNLTKIINHVNFVSKIRLNDNEKSHNKTASPCIARGQSLVYLVVCVTSQILIKVNWKLLRCYLGNLSFREKFMEIYCY